MKSILKWRVMKMEKEKIREMAKKYYELYKRKKEIEDRLFSIKYILVNELGQGIHDLGDTVVHIKKVEYERFNTKKFKMENPDIYSFYTYRSEQIRLIVELKGDKNEI